MGPGKSISEHHQFGRRLGVYPGCAKRVCARLRRAMAVRARASKGTRLRVADCAREWCTADPGSPKRQAWAVPGRQRTAKVILRLIAAQWPRCAAPGTAASTCRNYSGMIIRSLHFLAFALIPPPAAAQEAFVGFPADWPTMTSRESRGSGNLVESSRKGSVRAEGCGLSARRAAPSNVGLWMVMR